MARGAAAPTIRRDGRLWSRAPTAEPPSRTGAGPDPHLQDAAAPAVGVGGRRRRCSRPPPLAVAFVPDGDGVPPPGGTVSEAEVTPARELVRVRLRRRGLGAHLAAAHVRRAAGQPGEPPAAAGGAVVDAYQSQFAGNRTTGFELDATSRPRAARSGAPPPATARATTASRDTVGTMTWDVIRERGRPRIALILAAARTRGLSRSRAVSSVTVERGSTSVPAGGLRRADLHRAAEHAVEPAAAALLDGAAGRARAAPRSAASTLARRRAAGTSTRMSRSTRTASVGGRGGRARWR